MSQANLLLVEDNVLTRAIVRRAVLGEGWNLVEAGDGAEALHALDGYRPDLVLLDLLLPDGSGAALAPRLRAHPASNAAPILAFTGLLTQVDSFDAALFDGLIAKPIEPSYLIQQVRGHLPMRGGERRITGRGRRLLVADDDPSQLKLAKFRFAKLGFDVEAVGDGQAALEAARERRPDIIVTDALMPRLDGFGLSRAIREDAALRTVPIVLVTSSYVDSSDHQLALRTGANAYVVRTADLVEVVAAVERVLEAATAPVLVESPESWETVRSVRTAQQLDRQVAQNAALGRQCSTLAAELSVLSTVADALVEARDIESAMADVLAHCVDVAGTSRGAICLRGTGAGASVPVHHGFTSTQIAALPALLGRLGEAGQEAAVAMLSQVVDHDELAVVGLGPGAVAARLSSRGELLGYLVLDIPARAPDGWSSFVGSVANQVSFALALAKAFDRLSASEARSRALMENAADAIFALDPQGRVLDTNRAAERLSGFAREALHGRHIDALMPASQAARGTPPTPRQASEVDAGAAVPRVLRRADGTSIDVETTSADVDVAEERVVLLVVRDVSERNALAEQLRQSQRMDAMGRLASGVAHDFNNLLTIILSYSDFAISTLPEGSELRGDLEEIRKAGESAVHLTKQLLLFSRQQPQKARWVSVNDTLREMEKMLARIVSEAYDLVIAPDDVEGHVWIDPGSLQQVILNLVVNARDAMPQGGPIVVRTSLPGSAGAQAEDDWVVLSVCDVGTGIADDVKARIFEPFFTTKGASKGTGLGLSTVFGIVQRAGGRIDVQTALGEGSTFQVRLPRGDGAVPSSATRRGPTPTGNETVLVVEDDAQVRAVATGTLRRSGYRVLEARDPQHALELWQSAADPIHLVVTDLVMPGMSGVDLARRLLKWTPTVKVICMTGYLDPEAAKDAEASGKIVLLQKPIAPHELAVAVRSCLDGEAVPSSGRP